MWCYTWNRKKNWPCCRTVKFYGHFQNLYHFVQFPLTIFPISFLLDTRVCSISHMKAFLILNKTYFIVFLQISTPKEVAHEKHVDISSKALILYINNYRTLRDKDGFGLQCNLVKFGLFLTKWKVVWSVSSGGHFKAIFKLVLSVRPVLLRIDKQVKKCLT